MLLDAHQLKHGEGSELAVKTTGASEADPIGQLLGEEKVKDILSLIKSWEAQLDTDALAHQEIPTKVYQFVKAMVTLVVFSTPLDDQDLTIQMLTEYLGYSQSDILIQTSQALIDRIKAKQNKSSVGK